jgi:hypothetical protein
MQSHNPKESSIPQEIEKLKIRLSRNARYIATIVAVLYRMIYIRLLQQCHRDIFRCRSILVHVRPFVCCQRSIHSKRYLNPTPSSRRVTLTTLILERIYLRKHLNFHRREEKWQSRRQKIELSLNIPLGQRSTSSSMERP